MIVNSEFKFSQYRWQNDGGWCSGISWAILIHLYENDPTFSNLQDCYNQTEQYVSMLKTYNKITGSTIPGMTGIRNSIHALQYPYNFNFLGAGRATGTYEYNFITAGSAMLNLRITEPCDHNDGNYFQSMFDFISSPGNHTGVAVWDNNRNMFLFDPNCGGALISWNQQDVDNYPEAIDWGLRYLYRIYDRMRGTRCAKIVNALRLDANSLVAGNVS